METEPTTLMPAADQDARCGHPVCGHRHGDHAVTLDGQRTICVQCIVAMMHLWELGESLDENDWHDAVCWLFEPPAAGGAAVADAELAFWYRS